MRDASFHLLDRAAWPRSEHFDYYIRTVKCRYDLTAHLTVTALRERGKALGPGVFTRSCSTSRRGPSTRTGNSAWASTSTARPATGISSIRPIRSSMTTTKRFRTSGASTTNRFPFSTKTSCTTWKPTKISKESVPNPAGRPNCCPMSALPWLSFTGMAHVQATEPPFRRPSYLRQVLHSGAGHAPADRRHPSIMRPARRVPHQQAHQRHAGARRIPPTNGCAPDASAI